MAWATRWPRAVSCCAFQRSELKAMLLLAQPAAGLDPAFGPDRRMFIGVVRPLRSIGINIVCRAKLLRQYRQIRAAQRIAHQQHIACIERLFEQALEFNALAKFAQQQGMHLLGDSLAGSLAHELASVPAVAARRYSPSPTFW